MSFWFRSIMEDKFKGRIDSLFPTSIGFFKLFPLTEQNKKYFYEEENNLICNYGNMRTKNDRILDNEEALDLKNNILECVSIYINYIYKNPKNIYLQLTQSWINVTTENQYHHIHNHPNSFISGVYYYDVHDKEQISFTDFSKFNTIEIHPTEWTKENSLTWTYDMSDNDLILFPSSLNHEVPYKKTKFKRKSLAFNIFVRGTFGCQEKLNMLEL